MALTPQHLRAKCRVDLADMAQRLHVTVPDLRALEATPVRLWELGTLTEYAEALGYRVRLIVVRADGHEEELSS
jgi:hypothetical protein